MADETITYNKKDLRDVLKAFKLMDAQATEEARTQSAALAYFASEEIKATARTRTKGASAVQRIADGVSISKSSKIGEFSPTLRRIQPELINKWETAFDRILKEWA